MSTLWIIGGVLALLAAAGAIALIVSVIRNVEADRIDAGGSRRGKRRQHRIDLFGSEQPKR